MTYEQATRAIELDAICADMATATARAALALYRATRSPVAFQAAMDAFKRRKADRARIDAALCHLQSLADAEA